MSSYGELPRVMNVSRGAATTEAAFVAARDVNTMTDPQAAMDGTQQTVAATKPQLLSTFREQPYVTL